MQKELELTFRGIEPTEELKQLIQNKLAKIRRVCNYMISCSVVVEERHKHRRQGNPYRVRIDIHIPPGHEVIVDDEPSKGVLHYSVSAVISDAFETARRRVQKLVELQRRDIKNHHEEDTVAVVSKLFRGQDYGFIRTLDTNDEVYFHRNSVINHEFDRIDVGTAVRYVLEGGDKGLQASTVQIVEKMPSY